MNAKVLLTALYLSLFSSAFSQIHPLISYQGRVSVGTTPFQGTGHFKFALVNSSGNVSYWSNDNTSSSGGQPAQEVQLSVTNGLYFVLLGDSSLSGMANVPISAFAQPDVRLRVWFNDGTTGFQQLSPDQRLAPEGYLADGSVTTNKIADGSVAQAKLADGSVITNKMADGSVTQAKLADGSVTTNKITDGSITQAKLAFTPNAGSPSPLPNGMQEFLTAGETSYTVPDGVTRLQIEAWGGGGGAAFCNYILGGGGGGGYSRGIISVTPGQILTVFVGARGTPILVNNGDVGQAGNGGSSGIKTALGDSLISSAGGTGGVVSGGIVYVAKPKPPLPPGNYFVNEVTPGVGGAGDPNSMIRRSGSDGSPNSLPYGAANPNTFSYGEAAGDVAPGSGAPPLINHSVIEAEAGFEIGLLRRPAGSGGRIIGDGSDGAFIEAGFPGYVLITW